MEKKKDLVIKSNKIIQKASFDFTELELKGINYVIAQIVANKKITENEYIEIDIKDICLKMGITPKGHNYKLIRESFFELNNKSKAIKINNKGDILNFSFIMKVIANDNTGKMYIKVMNELVEMVNNYLIEKNFTIFELCNTLKLKKKYSIRLYELCKSWEKNEIVYNGKEINGFIFDIEKSRENWQIPKAYNYGKYKKQIIDTAIKEINEKTELNVKILDIVKDVKKIKSFVIQIENKQETKQEPKKSQTKAKQEPKQENKGVWHEPDERYLKYCQMKVEEMERQKGRHRNYTKEELNKLFDDLDNTKL